MPWRYSLPECSRTVDKDFSGRVIRRHRRRTDARRGGAAAPDDLIPPGLRGVLSLVDADSGRQLFITLFDSRKAIEAAESKFEQMGAQIPEEMRRLRVSRDYYEVAGGLVALTGELR